MECYFSVTKEDIKNGTPKSRDSCPLAIRIKEKFPTGTVAVLLEKVNLSIGNKKYVAEIPERVSDILMYYDEDGTTTPFKVRLNFREVT